MTLLAAQYNIIRPLACKFVNDNRLVRQKFKTSALKKREENKVTSMTLLSTTSKGTDVIFSIVHV